MVMTEKVKLQVAESRNERTLGPRHRTFSPCHVPASRGVLKVKSGEGHDAYMRRTQAPVSGPLGGGAYEVTILMCGIHLLGNEEDRDEVHRADTVGVRG